MYYCYQRCERMSNDRTDIQEFFDSEPHFPTRVVKAQARTAPVLFRHLDIFLGNYQAFNEFYSLSSKFIVHH